MLFYVFILTTFTFLHEDSNGALGYLVRSKFLWNFCNITAAAHTNENLKIGIVLKKKFYWSTTNATIAEPSNSIILKQTVYYSCCLSWFPAPGLHESEARCCFCFWCKYTTFWSIFWAFANHTHITSVQPLLPVSSNMRSPFLSHPVLPSNSSNHTGAATTLQAKAESNKRLSLAKTYFQAVIPAFHMPTLIYVRMLFTFRMQDQERN